MNRSAPVSLDFFERKDVVRIARELIGKYIITEFGNRITGGIITETEAYAGTVDRASHAYGGRRSNRTEVLYRRAGTIYVYLCYGVHSLFNIVTNIEGVPHAILIRSIFPVTGNDVIRRRRNKSISIPESALCIGPGNVSQGLGISLKQNGTIIGHSAIRIEDRGLVFKEDLIRSSPRIGVEYAGKDAALPYRFYMNHKELENVNLLFR